MVYEVKENPTDLDKLAIDFFNLSDSDRADIIRLLCGKNYGPLVFFEFVSLAGLTDKLREEVDKRTSKGVYSYGNNQEQSACMCQM